MNSLLFLSFSLGNRIKFLKDSNELAQAKTISGYTKEDIYMTIQQEESGVNSLTKRINNKNFIDCLKDYAKGIEWLN